MKFLLRCLLMASFVIPLRGEPEKEKEKEKKTPRTLRILPLGETPPFEQEVRDGVRYELEPPAGSIPPREVSLAVGKLSIPGLRLSIGRISMPVKLPNGTDTIMVNLPDNSPWLSLTPSETGNMLVLVWRDPDKKWDKPRSLLLPDGPEFRAGSLRLSNLSPVEIRFIIGEEKFALAPGRFHAFPIALGKDVPVQIAWVDGSGNARQIYSSAIVQNEGERGELIVYRADGEQPRLPFKVMPLREKAPEPPPEPK